MKNIQLCCLLILAVFLVRCDSSTSKNEDITEQNDVSEKSDSVENDELITNETLTSWDEDNFEGFWAEFLSKTQDDRDYFKAVIDFPYGDGFETITRADFEEPNSKYVIGFHEQTEITFSILDEDGYLNGNLADLFNERFGNLEGIYVARHEDLPIGYFAYFKHTDGTFKFIGFEDTQDASN